MRCSQAELGDTIVLISFFSKRSLCVENLNMEDMSGFDWNGPIGFASLELQLEVLGLNESFLEKLKQNKSRVLDIGCGETFELVKYLRLREINAEGLDPRIKEENEYLISMGLPKSSKEMGKKIPKPDNYYNLIFSH